MSQEEEGATGHINSTTSDSHAQPQAKRRVTPDYDETQPSYPFPAELHIEIGTSTIGVIRHLCSGHPSTTRNIVILFPGVHGGVGPCRTPGTNFCENALYPTLAPKLASEYDIDCYRCSWPYMRPTLRYAVAAGCRVLQMALEHAIGNGSQPNRNPDETSATRHIHVFFVGHSLGAMVAVQTALVVAARCANTKIGGANVNVVGFCTLNGAVDYRIAIDKANDFAVLHSSRALLIAGDMDAVVPPDATKLFYEALPIKDKRHLLLAGGEHDLYTCRQRLLTELEQFLTASLPVQ